MPTLERTTRRREPARVVRAPLLELDRVSHAFGSQIVLDSLSLSLEPGRLVGLLGPNGSGKSTLVRVAAGLIRPTRGVVRLEGQPLDRARRSDVARRVGVVPQGAPLPDAFTGLEIALMGRTPYLGWLGSEGPTDVAIAWRALELTGAAPFAARRAGELSGGERQRLLLARALAQEPDVLLLDEPTAHLDVAHQLAALDFVASLARSAGLAVLAVLHELHLAAEFFDELVVLDRGRVVAHGAPERVLTPELIAAVYGIPVTVLRHPMSGRPAILFPAAGSAHPPKAEKGALLDDGP